GEVKRAKAAHPRVRMKLLFPSYQIYFPVPSPNTLKTRLLQGSRKGGGFFDVVNGSFQARA
ncbi:hypothetical protein ACFQ2Z_23285, partial [Paenibacillus timonensis]